MAPRTRAKKNINEELANRFRGHRVWHFIRTASASGKDNVSFHHPVSKVSSMTYRDLFQLLANMGYTLHPKAPEGGFGTAVGVMEIGNITKVGSL